MADIIHPEGCRGLHPSHRHSLPCQTSCNYLSTGPLEKRAVSKQVLGRILNDHSKMLKNGFGIYANGKTAFFYFMKRTSVHSKSLKL